MRRLNLILGTGHFPGGRHALDTTASQCPGVTFVLVQAALSCPELPPPGISISKRAPQVKGQL